MRVHECTILAIFFLCVFHLPSTEASAQVLGDCGEEDTAVAPPPGSTSVDARGHGRTKQAAMGEAVSSAVENYCLDFEIFTCNPCPEDEEETCAQGPSPDNDAKTGGSSYDGPNDSADDEAAKDNTTADEDGCWEVHGYWYCEGTIDIGQGENAPTAMCKCYECDEESTSSCGFDRRSS